MRPVTRGRVSLDSADSGQQPPIDPSKLVEHDLEMLVRGVEMALRAQSAFTPWQDEPRCPEPRRRPACCHDQDPTVGILRRLFDAEPLPMLKSGLASSSAVASSSALAVSVITVTLVLLDIIDRSAHRYWSRHSFTSSVLSGVLVLLLTVLIIDRVARRRSVRNQSRAIAAQAAIIIAQAARTMDVIRTPGRPPEDRKAAAEELRGYTQMLLTSAPVLIDADRSRAFLEAAQRLAAEMFWALRRDDDNEGVANARLDAAAKQLRVAAVPVLTVLSPQERAALGPNGSP